MGFVKPLNCILELRTLYSPIPPIPPYVHQYCPVGVTDIFLYAWYWLYYLTFLVNLVEVAARYTFPVVPLRIKRTSL